MMAKERHIFNLTEATVRGEAVSTLIIRVAEHALNLRKFHISRMMAP